MSRRRFLVVAGTGTAALAAGAVTSCTDSHGAGPTRSAAGPQAGIVTTVQAYLSFAAVEVSVADTSGLQDLLRQLTGASERLVDAGRDSNLTITIGFGPSLFVTRTGADRFGIADQQPASLADLPAFDGDALDPFRSGGDLGIQACADDAAVAAEAIDTMIREAGSDLDVRWTQQAFGRNSTTSTSQTTPRNLFGFKDGTSNIKVEESGATDEFVWVGPDDDPNAGWLVGGSYLVTRRIIMDLDEWNQTLETEQETVFGRDKASGAPLSGGDEFDPPDFFATRSNGLPLIHPNSHMRLAHPDQNDDSRILRRGFNFAESPLVAGLFFIAYTRDPVTHFVPMQRRLASFDTLNAYTVHTGSAVFAVPPAAAADGFLGDRLFR